MIGVDLKSTSPVEGASIIQGDISKQETIDRIEELLNGRELNVVLSDISPKLIRKIRYRPSHFSRTFDHDSGCSDGDVSPRWRICYQNIPELELKG